MQAFAGGSRLTPSTPIGETDADGGGRMSPAAPAASPTPSPAPPHRAARAVVLTGTAVAVGVGAHLLGSGAVSLGGVAAAFAVLLALGWSLTDRERGWLPIAGAQLAGQQVVHSLLEWDAPTHPAAATGGLPADVLLYAHLLAAALMATWLRCGERRVWAAARRAVRAVAARWRVLGALIGYRAPGHRRPPSPGSAPLAAYVPELLRHIVTRRGPPVHV
jgi:hypothetical protein